MPQWLSGPEFIVIVLVIVVLFGWKKLPEAARSLGRSMRIFKAEVEEMKRGDSGSAASKETVRGETVPPSAAASAPAAQPQAAAETPAQREARIRSEVEAKVRAEFEAKAQAAAAAQKASAEQAERARIEAQVRAEFEAKARSAADAKTVESGPRDASR